MHSTFSHSRSMGMRDIHFGGHRPNCENETKQRFTKYICAVKKKTAHRLSRIQYFKRKKNQHRMLVVNGVDCVKATRPQERESFKRQINQNTRGEKKNRLYYFVVL